MNMFRRFKRWISPLFSSIEAKEESASVGGIERSQAVYWNTKLGKIEALNRDIKNLQISIFVAKKRKKKTSHFYAEMARLQAEILKLEAM